ncbi:MAG TPA: glutamate 5-kinase, partial [Patescibacteria group bacterium]
MNDLIVIKLGTSVVTEDDGRLDEAVLDDVVGQIAALHKKYRLIVVSSGAVAAGQVDIKGYSGKLPEQKAAAAIGNPRLIQDYANRFAKHGITVAQTLCERDVFADRQRFLRL